jgi:integrase
MAQRSRLTQTRIEALKLPETGEYTVADTEIRGLTLRVHAGGAMVWCLRYRTGGRGSPMPRLKLGTFPGVSLKDARDAAQLALGDRAKGTDPQAKRKEAARKERAQLGNSVESYVKDLEARGTAAPGMIGSLLRRELVAPLRAGTDLGTIDRAQITKRIDAIAESGRVAQSREFKVRASVFLNWCVAKGLIPHNPLLGMRLPRATRSQEVKQHGRALNEEEIRAFWHAAAVTDEPYYAVYLRALLLTGCRRTELAVARWEWVVEDDTGRSVLVLPDKSTKNGWPHAVPLPPPVLAMLRALPRRPGTDLIFPAWRGEDTPMTGWSKRWAVVTAEMGKLGVTGRVTMHDCRRTARTWWSKLNVPEAVCELMLNHRPKNRLVAIYNRNECMDERHRAAEHWAATVFKIAENATAAGCAAAA